MRCKKPNGYFINVTWRYFYPQCEVGNLNCNGLAGAWVAAITVCNQQLFF